MTIAITDLTTLPAATVQQATSELATLLQELNPSLQFSRGVLYDYLANYGGILAAKTQEEMSRLRRSLSLAEIIKDPSLADADTVSALASNFRVSRIAGQAATGVVTIVVDTLATITIAKGAEFAAGSQIVATTEAVTARTHASLVIGDTDTLLVEQTDGTYVFQVPVQAIVPGVAGQLAAGTQLTPVVLFTYFHVAYAAADFSGAMDEETNAELVERFRYGVSAKAISNRTNMAAAIREQTQFKDLVADSVIGAGDAEMTRDQHTIWPGSLGGRVDWYLRTQGTPKLHTLTKTATLVSKTSDKRGIWQFSLGRDEVPGFYRVSRIAPVNADNIGQYAVTKDTRGYDLTNLTGIAPDIENSQEAAYSRYQTAVIQFRDTDTDTTALTINSSTAEYSIVVQGMPWIKDGQDYVDTTEVRNVANDCLVRAAIPCFVRLAVTAYLPVDAKDLVERDIATAIMAKVNSSGFTGRLAASPLAQVIHEHLPAGASLSLIDLLGTIRNTDGTQTVLHSTEALEIPTNGDTSARTAVFIIAENDIVITVVRTD